jgi:hypothetical protein
VFDLLPQVDPQKMGCSSGFGHYLVCSQKFGCQWMSTPLTHTFFPNSWPNMGGGVLAKKFASQLSPNIR